MFVSRAWFRPVLVLVMLSLLMTPGPVLAAWPDDPGHPQPLVMLTGVQLPTGSIADGTGGYFLVWMDQRSGTFKVFAQHLDANGNVLWGANGLPVATTSAQQAQPQVALDGAGGIIVGWLDTSSPNLLFAQRLNAAGSPQWGATGVQVAPQPNNQGLEFSLCSDGAGGANFSWRYQFSPTDNDLYAQRLSPAGARMWGVSGIGVATSAANQEMPSGVTDGAGGMWLLWRDDRTTSYDIFTQHLNAAGAAQLAGGGINPETFVPGDIEGLVAAADGFGGVIGAFSLKPSVDSEVEMVHVYQDASALSIVVTSTPGDQTHPTLAVDPSGGAFVFWNDNRVDLRSDVFGSHVTNFGVISPGWSSTDGLPVASGLDIYQDTPVAQSDGEGGAIVAWLEGNFNLRQIVSQHFGPNAEIQPGWKAGGNPISTQPVQNQGQILASTGNGGVFCTWTIPNASGSDMFAQRIDRFGKVGTPEPKIVSVKDELNDQGGLVRVSWNKSPLDRGFDPIVHGYQVWKQVPQAAATAALKSGAARLLDAGAHSSTGGKVIRSIVNGLQTTYWEYAGGVAAQNFAGYSLSASTAGDSIGGSNPRTQFMVEAVDDFFAPGPVNPSQYWQSAPDSGYSVDNLPPSLPAAFAGSWTGSGASLHWNANTESDLAGYRLYRGNSPSFVPSPANRIASPVQTFYEDTGAPPSYYRLTAIDIHGNESPSALLLPSGTVDAPEDLPEVVSLSVTSANPARQSVSLRIELPAAATVDVAVYDAVGRRVRDLASGPLVAGRWPLTWHGERQAGEHAAPGVYFVLMRIADRTWSRRVVLVE